MSRRATRPSRPPPSEAIAREWGRRVEAEYRSAAITQHLGLWLIQIGASPDLIHDALRIVSDELAHAELSHAVFRAAGGGDVAPIARESLGLAASAGEPLEAAVTRACVEIFCLGETVAVPLFKVLREKCTVPVARRALDRVLRDEVRHREFGWTLLAWLVEQPCAPLVRELVAREIAGMFARVRRGYAPAGRLDEEVAAAERAWGLMPPARYGKILEATFVRDYRRRFGKLGFAVDAAWAAGSA